MARLQMVMGCLAVFILAGLCPAADLPLRSASGIVVSANPSVVIVRPRNAEGQFGEALALKVHGTSKFATLGARQQAGKTILVQTDASPRDLRKNQPIAVIYTVTPMESVLLSAVVPAPGGE